MRLTRSTFAAALLAASSAWASNVLEVTSKNFDALVGSTPSLVEFYAPWCGHCKNLAPVYEQLADAFASHKGKVQIVKTDADGEGKELGQKFGVSGFPTLKWFPNGAGSEPEAYEGGRDLEALAEFISKKAGVKAAIKGPPPPAYLQLDTDTFQSVAMNPEKDVLVAFTAPWCGHCKNMKPFLNTVAKNFESESNCVIADYNADAPQNKPLAGEYGVHSYPTIKFFPKGSSSKTPIDYLQPRTEQGFTDFLNEHCGTFRAVGGGLNDKAGRVATLDTLASQIFSAVPTSRAELYAEATKLGATLGESAKYYLRVMDKLVNGTEGFVEKEAKRLANILQKQKKTLAPRKLDEIKIKANILAAFVEQKVAEGVEAVSEEVKEAAGHIKAEL